MNLTLRVSAESLKPRSPSDLSIPVRTTFLNMMALE
jgi:hypothetical protein